MPDTKLFTGDFGAQPVINEKQNKNNRQKQSRRLTLINKLINLLKIHNDSNLIAKYKNIIEEKNRDVNSEIDVDKTMETKTATDKSTKNEEYTLYADEEKIISLINKRLKDLEGNVKSVPVKTKGDFYNVSLPYNVLKVFLQFSFCGNCSAIFNSK